MYIMITKSTLSRCKPSAWESKRMKEILLRSGHQRRNRDGLPSGVPTGSSAQNRVEHSHTGREGVRRRVADVEQEIEEQIRTASGQVVPRCQYAYWEIPKPELTSEA